jgi:Fe-S-cluster-containing hydrogenase component 2
MRYAMGGAHCPGGAFQNGDDLLVLEEKKCFVCGKVFEGVKKRRYCSRACQAKANSERHADQYRKAMVEKYQAEKKPTAR